MSFYNTISLKGEELQKANARALSQQELIEKIFKANPKAKISPSQMLEVFNKKYDLFPPITSIRRALTSLCYEKNGCVLEKTSEQVMGNYGMMEHLWILKTDALGRKLEESQNSTKSFVQTELF